MARFLITRALPEAEVTARLVDACGHEAIVAPLRTCVPLVPPMPTAMPDAWIATSASAFSGVGFQAEAFSLPIFVVGAPTARAAQNAGFTQIIAAKGDVAGLIRCVQDQIPERANLLYLTGTPRKPDLEAALSTQYRLTSVDCYRMEPCAPPPGFRAALTTGCDVALHFSAKSVQAYCEVARALDLTQEAMRPLHACLSRAVEAALRNTLDTQTPLRSVIAPEHTAQALIEASLAALRDQPDAKMTKSPSEGKITI